MKNEKDVKAKTKRLLDKYQWFWWMTPANGYGKAGISDLSAIKSGVFLAIENKFGSNKPTALQIGYLNSIRAEGGFAFVVNEKNIEWLEAFLESFAASTDAVAAKQMPSDDHGARMINAIAMLTNY